MRKAMILMLATLLLSNAAAANGIDNSSKDIKVLIDESRIRILPEFFQNLYITTLNYPEDYDWRYSFRNTEADWGFGSAAKKIQEVAFMDIRKSGKLDYSAVKDYDVLVILSFEEGYSPEEVDAIKKFVENGGGLLFFAYEDTPNNNVSGAFDVFFPEGDATIVDDEAKVTTDYTIYVTDIVRHPITEGVNQIILDFGVPITRYESGEVLAQTGKSSWLKEGIMFVGDKQKMGPFDILLALEKGKGRAVFFGGRSSFSNETVEEADNQNLELLANAVKWLGEPGGPYKQYNVLNENAQQVLADAQSCYESHNFSQGESKCAEALELFSESSEIYPNDDAAEGIEEAESYMKKCETGVKADTSFEDAEGFFNSQQYERAIEEYQKAKSLYEEIEYMEGILECNQKMDESNRRIALREEATALFQKGEGALVTAPSTFSPAGYESAKSLFEQARSKWQEYGDPAKAAACEEKINLCNEGIAKINKTRILIIAGVVAVVVVVMVVAMRKRKHDKQK
jgi:hypothetical protein